MYKVLGQKQLDASIKSFVSRKFDKFDVPVLPSQAKNGISSRLSHSQDLMKDCLSTDYIWCGDTSFAN